MIVKPKTSIKGTASVIMSRFSGGDEKFDGSGIHLTIEDATSGCRIIELTFTLEEFAKAVTASYGEADFEYYPACPVNKIREMKTEVVAFERTWPEDREAAKVVLKPFEVDGWQGDMSDLFNHHHRAPKGQRVSFHRFVDPPKEK